MKPQHLLKWAFALLALPVFTSAQDTPTPQATPHELPLWEIGLAGGIGRLPHYRGSDEYKTFAIPMPFFIYRGKFLRANRDGVKSIFWENGRFETGISLNGNPPVDDNNEAREGMPDLGAIIELGPQLKATLTDPQNPNPIYATAALRAAISINTHNAHTDYEGLRGDIKLAYRNRTWLQKWGTIWGVHASVDFADADFHHFFYEVEPSFATELRPAYTPGGGYSGCSLSIHGTQKLHRDWMIGAYYRWDNLAGTAYSESPLVRTHENHVLGVALMWNIYRSKAKSPYPGF